ncbi:MAG: alpha/beta hydrolase [Planctomycetes bacterium]|nr:alpha/beta hydrolase [Planctomycetota bacterium]
MQQFAHRTTVAVLAPLLVAAACATDAVALPTGPVVQVGRAVLDDGTGTHYVTGGVGSPTFVLIHGWGCDHTVFRAQLQGLVERRRVLALDLPGHGRSELPSGPLTAAHFIAAVLAAMDAAEIDAAVLVGHSNGAPVAMAVAREAPERALAVVSLDGEIAPLFSVEQRRSMAAPFHDGDPHTLGRDVLRRMLRADMPPELADDLEARLAATAARTLRESLDAMCDPLLWRDQPVRVPVVFVGTAAPFWTAAWRQRAERVAPDLRWRTVDDAGHLLMLERPDVVDEELERLANELAGQPQRTRD